MKRALFLFLLVPFLLAQTATEVEITAEPSHHLALDNEYVRVFKVEVAPHSSTLMHRHRHDYTSRWVMRTFRTKSKANRRWRSSLPTAILDLPPETLPI